MSLTYLLGSPGRFQGPLTRNQHKVLVGRGFPVPFSSGFLGFFFGLFLFLFLFLYFCFLGWVLFFCGPECDYIERLSPGWNMHACACKSLLYMEGCCIRTAVCCWLGQLLPTLCCSLKIYPWRSIWLEEMFSENVVSQKWTRAIGKLTFLFYQ